MFLSLWVQQLSSEATVQVQHFLHRDLKQWEKSLLSACRSDCLKHRASPRKNGKILTCNKEGGNTSSTIWGCISGLSKIILQIHNEMHQKHSPHPFEDCQNAHISGSALDFKCTNNHWHHAGMNGLGFILRYQEGSSNKPLKPRLSCNSSLHLDLTNLQKMLHSKVFIRVSSSLNTGNSNLALT